MRLYPEGIYKILQCATAHSSCVKGNKQTFWTDQPHGQEK